MAKNKLEKSLHIPVVIGTHPTEEGKRELKQRLKIAFSKCLLFLITILNLAIEKNRFPLMLGQHLLIKNVVTDIKKC